MKSWFILIALLTPLPFTTFQSTSTEKVNLQLANTRITENGETLIEVGGKCGGGKVLAFHLPQKGWFVCSVETYAGYDFQRIAKLNGNRIGFSIDNREYEIISDEVINSGSQALDLYVVRITPPADKADAASKIISCSTDFKYWLETTLLREEKK
jgi:hypothetical protein